ncbi:hypothetical protein JXA40_01580 [bacterium]|nr:hypothetical protein [candidate division CSSED10-310 bacterium]
MNWKEIRWKRLVVPVVAIAAAQTLYGILFFAAAALLQNRSISIGAETILFGIGLVSMLAAAMFLGRVLEERLHWIWIMTGLAASIWPWISQAISGRADPAQLMHLGTWATVGASSAFWYLGAWAGQLTHLKYPSEHFDTQVFRWVGIVVAVLIGLNIVSWGSIRFSKTYRMAKSIEMELPEGVAEKKEPIGDPWIGSYRRFETVIAAGDTALYDFYARRYQPPQFADITEKFNSGKPGEWEHIQERVRDEDLDYRFLSARWLDLSGKIMVTLLLHAERMDPSQAWDQDQWMVEGIIYSRPYVEPSVTPSPVPTGRVGVQPEVDTPPVPPEQGSPEDF